MPRFTELTADDRQKLAQQGINPDEGDYILDSDTGDVWNRADAPPLGMLGQLGAAVQSTVPGAAQTLLAPVKMAGSIADLIRKGTGDYDPADPSALTTVADKSQENAEGFLGKPDARAHWLSTGIGRGIGQLGTLLGGGALAAARGGLSALPGIAGVTSGVGGLMNAQSTLDRENARQEAAGINRPGLAAGKAAAAGTLGALSDYVLGPGRLVKAAGSPTTIAGSLGRGLLNAGAGAATEGVQQGTEDLLVTGQVDPRSARQAATVGGIVQGLGGLAVDLPLHKTAEEVKAESKPAATTDAMQLVADQTAQANQPITNPEMPAIMAAFRAGEKWDPPSATPFDKAVAKLQDKKVVLNEDDINNLFSAQTDEEGLNTKVRELFARDVANRAAKPRPVVEQISGELAVRNKYDSVRKDLEGRLEKMSKDLEKNPGLGNQAIFSAKQKLFQEQLAKLTEQESLELGALKTEATQGMDVPKLPGEGEAAMSRPGQALPQPDMAAQKDLLETQQAIKLQPTADQKTAERAILAPPVDEAAAQRARERQILTSQEDEQSYPFGETRYSTIVPPKVDSEVRKFIGETLPALKNVSSIDPFYIVGRGTTSMMAQQNPTGGLIKYMHDVYLNTRKDAYHEQLNRMTAPAEKFLKSEKGNAWAKKARETKSWDVSGLTPEEQAAALSLKKYIEFTRKYANEQGVYVHEIQNDGSMLYRPGKLVPGWTPASPGQQVYDAALEGGDKWLSLRKDFMDSWHKHFGPNTDEMAEAAMEKMIPSLGKNKGEGEPLFSPVILPKGVDLPKSWQSESVWDGLVRYNKRYAQHMAWAKTVQNTPEGRAAFGLKTDAMGRKDAKLVTWADRPDAWRAAVREGNRAMAKWARNADPNKPPNTPIVPFYNPTLVDAMLMSYKQSTSDSPGIQAMHQLASRGLLGTFAGLRDAGQGTVTAAVYGDVPTAAKSMLEYLTGKRGEKVEAAERAGAITGDVLETEGFDEGGRLAKGMMKTARFMGKWLTGREELDRFGKVLLFDTIQNLPEAQRAKMLAEFGPVEKMDPAEATAYTAARISKRASNTSTAENLPPAMLPQSNHPLGKYFGLMRWSIGQYNNFKEDIVGPMFQGESRESLERFFKLAFGSLIAGSLVNALIDTLMDRKPNNMTWGELLHLFRDDKIPLEKKIDELAYTTLANMQLSGAFGWVGDMALAGVRAKAGGKSIGDPLDAQYPLLILGLSAAKTVNSYAQAVKTGRAGPEDFGQLLQELSMATQNGRVVNRIAEVTGLDTKEIRKPVRDSEMVKRVFEINPKTGRDIKPAAGMLADAATDPFSATKQALRIPESEYKGRLGGFLQAYRAPDGRPFTLNRWKQWPGYYSELERLVGKEEAERSKKEADELDKTILKKNRALLEASRP